MADTPPAGFETGSYTHPLHTACPRYGGPVDIILYIPTDQTDWEGVICACGQQLEPSPAPE